MSAFRIRLVVSVVVMAAFAENPSANDDWKLSETNGRRHGQYAIYDRLGRSGDGSQINPAHSPRNRYGQPTGYEQLSEPSYVYGQRNVQAYRYGQFHGSADHILGYGDIKHNLAAQHYGYQTGYDSDDTKDYETKGETSNAYTDYKNGYESSEERQHELNSEQSQVDHSNEKSRDSDDDEKDYETESGGKSEAIKGNTKSNPKTMT